MELKQAIYHRRSVRKYTDQAVESAAVHELIRAAIRAPSAMNQQPWAFGVIHGRKRLRGYSDRVKAHLLGLTSTDAALHLKGNELLSDPDYNIFYDASTLIVIYASPARLNPAEDCCLAAQNLMLMAHGLGLGTCPIGFARPWLNMPEIKQELEVPLEHTAIFPVIVGFPAGKPEPVPRLEPVVLSWT